MKHAIFTMINTAAYTRIWTTLERKQLTVPFFRRKVHKIKNFNYSSVISSGKPLLN